MPTQKQSLINRKKFYNNVKQIFFNGKLSQSQVDGMDHILNEWDRRQLDDQRWLAYMFATVYHETAKTMQPIEEFGKGKGKKYGKPEANGKIYYGRGFVQLTWPDNYKKFGIYQNPDLALDCNVATTILFEGMTKGVFTGRRLSDYFYPGTISHQQSETNWVNARKIINILDQAERIAAYGKKFYSALL